MDLSISDRIRGFVALAMSAAMLGGLLSCVTTEETPGGDAADAVLSEVWIHRDGGTAVVDLMGAQAAVFSSFQREDPARLIVDLGSVRIEGLASPIPSHDDFVTQVSVTAFSGDTDLPTTRVEPRW
jgi:hypothetical protein